jgi:hypothetical protein
MKYTVEMGSGAMTYIPSSIETGSDIQKLIGGKHGHTSLLPCFFQNNERRLTKHIKYRPRKFSSNSSSCNTSSSSSNSSSRRRRSSSSNSSSSWMTREIGVRIQTGSGVHPTLYPMGTGE